MSRNEIPWNSTGDFLKKARSRGWNVDGIPRDASSSKYHNQAMWVGEIRFQSKREAAAWLVIQARWKAGDLVFPPLRQVPIHLPGKTKYVADFLYQEQKTGKVVIADAKGWRTKEYKTKRRMVLDLYGIAIEEI